MAGLAWRGRFRTFDHGISRSSSLSGTLIATTLELRAGPELDLLNRMEDWELAVHAALERKAIDPTVLDIGRVSTFTEQFVICHGTNSRQVQAIADSIHAELKSEGRLPLHIEGYERAEWVLLDYGDFVAHVFAKDKRYYYDLERLWRTAPRLPVPVAA